MALGDCKSFPCGSPLDFDRLLVSLFAKYTDGCIGLKTSFSTAACADLTPATSCGQNLTLEEIITRAIVDDGAGGNALSVISITDNVTCADDCAVYQDVETLLKSLFVEMSSGCFALKVWSFSLTCDDLEGYDECSASLTAGQVFRSALWQDPCGDPVLGVYQGGYDECAPMDCNLTVSFDFVLREMFRKYSGAHCGAFLLNQAAVGVDTLTDLQECGLHMTFEDAFRAAITESDCGPALTVWALQRGGMN